MGLGSTVVGGRLLIAGLGAWIANISEDLGHKQLGCRLIERNALHLEYNTHFVIVCVRLATLVLGRNAGAATLIKNLEMRRLWIAAHFSCEISHGINTRSSSFVKDADVETILL
jgi:hypothetical protein